MLTFAQFKQMEAAMYRAVSEIPHVDNKRVIPSGPNADAVFASRTHGIGHKGVREVHVDTRTGVETTFNWVYAAPLRDPHF
jgi:hypothetical protein